MSVVASELPWKYILKCVFENVRICKHWDAIEKAFSLTLPKCARDFIRTAKLLYGTKSDITSASELFTEGKSCALLLCSSIFSRCFKISEFSLLLVVLLTSSPTVYFSLRSYERSILSLPQSKSKTLCLLDTRFFQEALPLGCRHF